MSIDDHIEAVRMAYKMAREQGVPQYVVDDITGLNPGPAVGPIPFGGDVQLRVTPAGTVEYICDACGLGMSPLERQDAQGGVPIYPAADLIV